MGINHVSWSSIERLHNVVRHLNLLKERDGTPQPVVTYRGKVKLHGTNCAVQVRSEGVFMQSRTGLITPEADYKGFAKWATARGAGASGGDHWRYFDSLTKDITIFGEWAGPGVEQGVALADLPEKVFAVFAIQVGDGADARVVFDPDEILGYLHGSAGWLPRNMHVLPWYGPQVTIDYRDPASLDAAAVLLNGVIDTVEREDPWVKETFGVAGVGEGVVFYPVAVGGGAVPVEPEAFAHLMFKAKGDEHKNTGAKQPVQVAAEVLASTGAFVDFMVTPARLAQGVQAACAGAHEKRHTAKFLAWVVADVRKESVAELEASGLSWAQVEKAVQERARFWFLGK